jgi:hypothetical protein
MAKRAAFIVCGDGRAAGASVVVMSERRGARSGVRHGSLSWCSSEDGASSSLPQRGVEGEVIVRRGEGGGEVNFHRGRHDHAATMRASLRG